MLSTSPRLERRFVQDAPETIEKVLRSEQDLSTKRNAFAMLANHAQDRAVRFLFENLEVVSTWGDILQMAVLDLIRKVCKQGEPRKRSGHSCHGHVLSHATAVRGCAVEAAPAQVKYSEALSANLCTPTCG